MAGDFQSSFIPKEPTKKRRKRKTSKSSIMGLVTVVIIVLVVLSVVGVFVYQKYLENSLNSKIEELKSVEENLNPALISELVKLDKRLNASEGLLENHVALSNLFTELENETSHQIRFNSLDFDVDNISGLHTISMQGESRNYNAVAHQSDVFGNNPNFRDVVFSDLAIDSETGNVTFDFSATVDPSLIDYEPNSGSGI